MTAEQTDYCCEAAAYLARVRERHAASQRARYWRKKDGDNTPDPVAVERACAGNRSVPLTRKEMAAAYARLDARGRSAHEIADVLGVTSRTVNRWRAGRTRLPFGRSV